MGSITLRRIFLRARSIGLTKTLWPLAGVLLGKTSLDSLYGLMRRLPQTVRQFLATLIRPVFKFVAAPND
jgi:hypothetical protein